MITVEQELKILLAKVAVSYYSWTNTHTTVNRFKPRYSPQ